MGSVNICMYYTINLSLSVIYIGGHILAKTIYISDLLVMLNKMSCLGIQNIISIEVLYTSDLKLIIGA